MISASESSAASPESSPPETAGVRALLEALKADDATHSGSSQDVQALLYERLRALAASAMSRQRAGHTLQPTALVHEAWLKLAGRGADNYESRSHFLAVAASAMRQVLVDYARTTSAAKRGGDWRRITLGSDLAEDTGDRIVDLLALDESLRELARLDERKARIVELRFFAGLSVEESAHVLGMSRRSFLDNWRVARAWLATALSDAGER